MAEVEIQRKQGGFPVWALLLGLLVLAALAWWLVSMNNTNRVSSAGDLAAPTQSVMAPTAPGDVEAANANLPLAAIQEQPSTYFNKWVSGMGMVSDVLSNRAFWIEQDGKQMLVVKAENIVETTKMVPGNKVSFSGMVVDPATAADKLPSMDKLQESTLETLKAEPAFIQATNIELQNS